MRQIGLFVRAGSLACHDAIAVTDDEKLLIARPDRQDWRVN
jgi:hypothetical protein